MTGRPLQTSGLNEMRSNMPLRQHNRAGIQGEIILGWTTGAIPLAKNKFCRIIKNMSAQEILIEEIRRQPEPVVREVLHYLKFLERQRAQEDWADVLPSREVEQEKLDILDGK